MNNKLMQIKLVSGEEIIGRGTSFSNTLTIQNALEIIKVQYEDEGTYYTMRNWFYNQFEVPDNKVTIPNSSIIAEFNPTETTTKQYNSTVQYFDNQREQSSFELVTDSGDTVVTMSDFDKSRLN